MKVYVHENEQEELFSPLYHDLNANIHYMINYGYHVISLEEKMCD
jgi:hypothetical protein